MMDELYRFHSSIPCPIDTTSYTDFHVGDGSTSNTIDDQLHVISENYEVGLEMSDVIKAQIANHPLYPNLLSAYIECRKVGAPPEMASVLEEISKGNHPVSTIITEIGTDPELDEFMKSYCEVLHKYKEELSKPFDEATNFLSSIESQFTNLCNETLNSTIYYADEGCGPSDEDMGCGEGGIQEGNGKLKDMLMHKYSGYLSSLRKEFLKKRKKGKLPKHARTALLEWWNTHYRWPYPTEEEKNRLSETTGLDQKQINNWFINQRKRHWRPSEDMRFALMESASGTGSVYCDATTGGTGDIGT